MNKILFLDIDGVLNSSPSEEIRSEWSNKYNHSMIQRKLYGFDPELVKLLKLIIDATNCKIVFSTSWRFFKDHHIEGDDWRKTLADLLNIDQSKYFIGDTPELGYYTPDRRGLEIVNWMKYHQNSNGFKICIIDDEIGDIKGIIPESRIVHTDSKCGLSLKEVDMAINILNKE